MNDYFKDNCFIYPTVYVLFMYVNYMFPFDGVECRKHTLLSYNYTYVMDRHDAIILYVFCVFIWFSNRWRHLVINV